MLARRYETRLDEDGLITFEKVWSKRIDIKKKTIQTSRACLRIM